MNRTEPAAAVTTADEVDTVVRRSAAAAEPWADTSLDARARALRTVADALDAAGDELVPLAVAESHLAEARLRGELKRTTFQLRLFASVLEAGTHLDVRIDHPDPEWPMGAPRPDLRRMLVPLGPTLVFAASNFPFAFSVAGGDTASALAAGCPVVVKTHPGHPALSRATAAVVSEALRDAGAPDGVFTTVTGVDAGIVALRHPLVTAAAFTGSPGAGRALFDIARSRPEPIPFHGELGSLNPIFVTRSAARNRPDVLRGGLVASFSSSAGQLCTKPGVAVVPASSGLTEALRATSLPPATPLLNDKILDGYAAGLRELVNLPGMEVVAGDGSPDDRPGPVILRTTAALVAAGGTTVLRECFGPVVVVIEYETDDEMLALARSLEGQLTATVHGTDDDQVAELLGVLRARAGRLLWNEWPTGVSVTYAQHHGGPYPATTTPGTSVGTAAIERFLRPVAFQNMPDRFLPAALRDGNPLAVPRLVDGVRE